MNLSKLAGAVATIFGTCQVLVALSVLLSPLLFFSSKLGTSATVLFQDEKIAAVSDHSTETKSVPGVEIESAEVRVRGAPEIRGATVYSTATVAMLVLAFAWCHMLARLFRNVQRGDIFSDLNLRLIRRAAAIQVACSLLFSALSLSQSHELVAYLAAHTQLKLQAAFSASSIVRHLDIGGLVTGLVMLTIAEVFRRGLALQTEADLTV
ncbi:MAG TPA: DUF2975 domain-containing protein [Opitutaceae bacterium]|nr:DUF2975 domain-containing protein [Opitutaceae bacterium]